VVHGEEPSQLEKAAVISDVHGNVPALEAVLDEVLASGADVLVSCGDLTWGPEPTRTVEVIRSLPIPVAFVRGNGDRAVLELADGVRKPLSPLELWMLRNHSSAAIALLRTFQSSVCLDVRSLGQVRFCHGSPRSDIELVTPATPDLRFRALASSMKESILVTGHTHLQFDRVVGQYRSINPGSVGLPYHTGSPGTAYWALLGEGVELRQTTYDVGEALRRATDYPNAARIATLLLEPPTPAEVFADAEQRQFSD